MITQFVFTILCGILFAGVHYGMGSHNIDVSASNFIQATKVGRPSIYICPVLVLTNL
jgi:hypothetical protein